MNIKYTKRLIIRPFVMGDFSWFSDLMQDPEVMFFSPQGPLTDVEAHEILVANIESFGLRDFGLMACCLNDELQTPIGFCGIALREIDGILYPELGYRLFSRFWGCGYATEAAIFVRDDAFIRLGFTEIVSFIDPKNIRSIRVATKIGEEFAFHATYKTIDIAVYKMEKKRFFSGCQQCAKLR